MTDQEIDEDLDPTEGVAIDPHYIVEECDDNIDQRVDPAISKNSKLHDNPKYKSVEMGLRARAVWISDLYDLDLNDVLGVLRQTYAGVDRIEQDEFKYLKFEPSLELALGYYEPEVALSMFRNIPFEKISSHLRELQTKEVEKKYSKCMQIEDVCHMHYMTSYWPRPMVIFDDWAFE